VFTYLMLYFYLLLVPSFLPSLMDLYIYSKNVKTFDVLIKDMNYQKFSSTHSYLQETKNNSVSTKQIKRRQPMAAQEPTKVVVLGSGGVGKSHFDD
jgi:hypothetical protein